MYVSKETISLGDFQKFHKIKNQKLPGTAQKSIKSKIARERHFFAQDEIFCLGVIFKDKMLLKTKIQKWNI